MEHLRECGVPEQEICVALPSHKKRKFNGQTLFFTTVLSDTGLLKHLTILITVMRIEQLFVAHISLDIRRVTEDETNIEDNKISKTPIRQDTQSKDTSTHFSLHRILTDNHTPWRT
jgi:hypothetical protein